MGVTRTAPWWLNWILVGALALLYLGERVFNNLGFAGEAISLLGAAGVLVCVVGRAISWRSASGEARGVERILFLGTLGCALSIAIWFATTSAGMELFRIGFATAAEESRFKVTAQIAWILLLGTSLLPILGAQIALGAHRHARGDVAGVEAVRISEAASAGLSVALVLAGLFLVGFIASKRDKILDLSYFRTSAPGSSTEAMVSGLFSPLHVHLFFPETNEVKQEALRYFRRLQESTRNVQIDEYDRLVSRAVASEYGVGVDGTIVLTVGDRIHRIVLPVGIREARPVLRSLDVEVQGGLLGLIQGNRIVYLTVGHGEMNDPGSAGTLMSGVSEGGFSGGSIVREDESLPSWMRGDNPYGRTNLFRQVLTLLNYETRDIGLQSGLANEIPENAAMVAILGPLAPFHPQEIAAIDRYLERGGSLLLALRPESNFELGLLERRLGVRYFKTPLAIDIPGLYVVNRGTLSDRQILVTDVFYSHPSMKTLTDATGNVGVVFVGPGYLEETEEAEGKLRQILIEATNSTFADLDGDFEFDEGVERRFRYALAIASQADTTLAREDVTSESETEVQDGGAPVALEPEQPWRAITYADSEIFSDEVLGNVPLNQYLLADGARWLGRDEAFAGTTETETDVAIIHTRSEHVAWFYAIIMGAPFLVLAGGLVGVFARRRSRGEA